MVDIKHLQKKRMLSSLACDGLGTGAVVSLPPPHGRSTGATDVLMLEESSMTKLKSGVPSNRSKVVHHHSSSPLELPFQDYMNVSPSFLMLRASSK